MAHDHSHEHPHTHGYGHHSHLHGWIDPTIAATQQGLWAIKWSCVGLLLTAGLQLVVVLFSGSVALLADTVHNVADAATALPLWVAFVLSRLPATKRFSYGYGRVEDVAGILIVLTILFSALVAGYQAVLRLLYPEPVTYLWMVALAGALGFLGNEAVAVLRIRVGRAIGSAALEADGYHARADGFTSLAVLAGALGVWLGYPLADPVIGLLITASILGLVWQSARAVFLRVLDGIEPSVLKDIEQAARHVHSVRAVVEVRARWIGHRLSAELNIAVDPALSVTEGHQVAKEARHQILHHLPHISGVTVHVDPATEAGDGFHRVEAHAHDGLPLHSHA
ncbi:MAG: cation transporter [Nitrospinae bacterium]|nr:cation transporter [Nitrospinota bacterium]